MKVKFTDGVKLSGKSGKLVYYELNGKTYARKAPRKSNKPRTKHQKMLTKRMVLAIKVYSRVIKGTLLAKIWKIAAEGKQMNGYNYFTKKNCRAINVESMTTDLSLIQISDGSLGLPHKLEMDFIEKDTIRVKWDNNFDIDIQGKNNDQMYLLFIYDENVFRYILLDNLDVHREDGGCELMIPNAERKPDSMFYFFGSNNKDKFSPSKYFRLKT